MEKSVFIDASKSVVFTAIGGELNKSRGVEGIGGAVLSVFGGVVCAAAVVHLTNMYVVVLLDQTIARCSLVTSYI